jgi:hypothetical protein
MPEEIFGTGACGVNCLACRLATTGVCSPCGPGTSDLAAKKLAAQLRLVGGYCPILKCASDRRIAFCLRDCDQFPCRHFQDREYPFSNGFLEMQARRRKEVASKSKMN